MKNLAGLMKQAQEMQSKMTEMQESLGNLRISGAAGAGLVEVTLSGKGEMTGLRVDDSLMKPEEKEILEDLILEAHRQAKAKLEAEMAEKMKDITGGMPLPPGMNFGL